MDRYLNRNRGINVDRDVAPSLTAAERRAVQAALNNNNNVNNQESKPRGSYGKYTPDQRFKAGKYAVLHGSKRAAAKFGYPESTVKGWKNSIEQKQKETGVPVTDAKQGGLVDSKRGRPLLLGMYLHFIVYNCIIYYNLFIFIIFDVYLLSFIYI